MTTRFQWSGCTVIVLSVASVLLAVPMDAPIDAELRRLVRHEMRGQIALDHVWQLTTFDRTATTEGYHQAVEYIMEHAQRAGLRNAEVIRFPADGRTRTLDTYRVSWAWRFGGGELAYDEPLGRICRYEDIPTCIVKYSPAVNGTFEVVDVGSGVSEADYEGKEVQGKVVLASSPAAAVVAFNKGRHDIAGVISCWGNYLPERSPFPDQVPWQATAQDRDSEVFAFSISRRMTVDLRRRLDAGPVRVRARIDAELYAGEYELVTGVLPGGDLAEEEILVISHLNHHRPGANDNASGSALSLEIIDVLTRLLERGAIPPLRRTVRFLWVPEHRGTQIWLHLNRDYAGRGVAVINNDMVGADQAESGSIFLLTRTPDFMPSYLNDLMESLLEEVAREQFRSPYGSRNPFHYQVVPYSGAISDHFYFVDRTVSVPAIMLSTYPDSFYHSNEDSADHIDATTLMRAGYVTASAVIFLATAGPEETVPLAQLVAGSGGARLASTLGDALMRLRRSHNAPESYLREANRLDHVTAREIESIRSVTRLGSTSETRQQIALLEDAIRDQAAVARRSLDRLYALERPERRLPKGEGIEPNARDDTGVAKRVPVRHFFGPLRFSWFQEQLSTDRREWYASARLGFLGPEAIVNYINGERTVGKIHAAVSAELGELPLADVAVFLDDLVGLSLVSWR